MKKKTSYILGSIYSISNAVYLIILLINFPWPNSPFGFKIMMCADIFVSYLSAIQNLLLLGSFSTIFVSGFFLLRLRINRSILFGIIGIILHGITVFLFVIITQGCYDIRLVSICLAGAMAIIISLIIAIYQALSKKVSGTDEESKIRQTILDMGTKFTRITIKEISEKSNIDKNSIIRVIKDMIENQEIFGVYFNSSKTISFNQQANIDEIDELMDKFKEWEEEKIGKI